MTSPNTPSPHPLGMRPSSSLTSDNIIVYVCLCSCCVHVLVFMLHTCACVHAVGLEARRGWQIRIRNTSRMIEISMFMMLTRACVYVARLGALQEWHISGGNSPMMTNYGWELVKDDKFALGTRQWWWNYGVKNDDVISGDVWSHMTFVYITHLLTKGCYIKSYRVHTFFLWNAVPLKKSVPKLSIPHHYMVTWWRSTRL